MIEPTSVTTILSSLKSAADIAKLIRESGLSLEKAEVKLQLAELISALADAKLHIAEVQESILEKDRAIRELREQLERKQSLIYTPPYYWRMNGQEKDGPFCQHCYDSDGKLARLQLDEPGSWVCRLCRNYFQDGPSRPRQPGIARSDYDPFDN